VDTNEAEEKSDKKAKWTPSIGVLGCAGVLVGGLIVLLFVSSIIGTPETPLLARFSAIDRWAGFFANLVVVFYVFPTFKLTKDRAFLFLGFGALGLCYGALFSLLFGIRPPTSDGTLAQAQVQLYYATRYFADIIGLALYAWGVILLARNARGGKAGGRS
jgi:hypothetical protein